MVYGLVAGWSLFVFAAHGPLGADVVTLKNGQELEGLVTEVSDLTIRLRKGAGHVLVSRDLSRSEIAAVRLSPPDVSDLRELARLQELDRAWEDATETLRQVCTLWPESAQDQLRLAQDYRKLKKYQEAMIAADAAARADPRNARIPLEQGEISLAIGDAPGSVHYAREHLRLSGEDGLEGNWLLGRGCELGEQVDEALDAYRKVLKTDPRLSEVLDRFTDLALRAGKAQAAIEEAEKILHAAPALRAGWLALGKAQYHLGKFPEAVDTFQSATALGGADYPRARVYLQCARARKAGVDPETVLAREDLEIASHLDSNLRREKP